METVSRAIGTARVQIMGSIRGLVSETEEVRAAFDDFQPEAVALPLGPRELEEIRETLKEKGRMPGLPGNRPAGAERRHGPSGLPDDRLAKDSDGSDYDDFGLFVSTSDLVFARHLAKWGEVEMPPPSYQEAVRLGHERAVTVEGVDFDDEEYTEVFLNHVSAFSLLRQGRQLRKLTRRKFKASDPAAFAREWDALITRVRGYREVETARELKIAAGILAGANAAGRVLAIIEAERLTGTIAALDRTARAKAAQAPEGGP